MQQPLVPNNNADAAPSAPPQQQQQTYVPPPNLVPQPTYASDYRQEPEYMYKQNTNYDNGDDDKHGLLGKRVSGSFYDNNGEALLYVAEMDGMMRACMLAKFFLY